MNTHVSCVKHILQNTLKSKSSKGLLHFLTFELSKAENSKEHHPSSLFRTILLFHLQVLWFSNNCIKKLKYEWAFIKKKYRVFHFHFTYFKPLYLEEYLTYDKNSCSYELLMSVHLIFHLQKILKFCSSWKKISEMAPHVT